MRLKIRIAKMLAAVRETNKSIDCSASREVLMLVEKADQAHDLDQRPLAAFYLFQAMGAASTCIQPRLCPAKQMILDIIAGDDLPPPRLDGKVIWRLADADAALESARKAPKQSKTDRPPGW